MQWDEETLTPSEGLNASYTYASELFSAYYALLTSPKYLKLVKDLYENRAELTPEQQRTIELAYLDVQQNILVPKRELLRFQALLGPANQAWKEAKAQSNYAPFKPYLLKIINYQKKLTLYLETPTIKGYDVLLNLYEEGANTVLYDEFFQLIKEKLVPIVKNLKPQTNPISLTKFDYPEAQQEQVSHFFAHLIGFDENKGVIAKSVHPFTSGFHPLDVRITTRYLLHNPESNLFSTLHEAGHAIFEQNINPAYSGTPLAWIHNMALHESQSRFYENMIGRHPAFWEQYYPDLQHLLPLLGAYQEKDFYEFITHPEVQPIRIEADELTYPIHCLIRYEIEKMIFNEGLKVDQIPAVWNALVEEYLGIKVKSPKEGMLQDSHWSGGMFGYFPTYALGSAFSAQIYHAIDQELNIQSLLEKRNLTPIKTWLNSHIHQYGAYYPSFQILETATGEPFNPQYYLDYLIQKYGCYAT
jgi:carboxypeptidase Taq